MHCPMSLAAGRGCLALSGCVLYANLCDERHALLECPALTFFARLASCLLCAQLHAAVFMTE